MPTKDLPGQPLERRPGQLAFACPLCTTRCIILDLVALISVEDCTLDCAACDALLVIHDNTVYPFHAWLNARETRWPEDGAGTAFIEV